MDPVNVPLTLARRVVYDRSGNEWRVAFYAPAKWGEYTKKLARRAESGSDAARRELDAIGEVRTAGKGQELATILSQVMYTRSSPKEREDVRRYILAREREGAAA